MILLKKIFENLMEHWNIGTLILTKQNPLLHYLLIPIKLNHNSSKTDYKFKK